MQISKSQQLLSADQARVTALREAVRALGSALPSVTIPSDLTAGSERELRAHRAATADGAAEAARQRAMARRSEGAEVSDEAIDRAADRARIAHETATVALALRVEADRLAYLSGAAVTALADLRETEAALARAVTARGLTPERRREIIMERADARSMIGALESALDAAQSAQSAPS